MQDMFGNICEYDDRAIDPKHYKKGTMTSEEIERKLKEHLEKIKEAHKNDPPLTSREIVERWGKLLKH